jgi:hypothetical protein
MASLFNRLKVWTGLSIVQDSDLNAEFDNILNNLGPAGMSGWSATVAQMQIQTSPGAYGSESLATSTNGEFERLRYQINAIIGGPDGVWYDSPSISLSQISKSISTVAPSNRIASCATVSGSQVPLALVPNGTANTVTLNCSGTPFVCYVNGTAFTFNSNIVSSVLTNAASSNNTFAINDTNATGQAATLSFGASIMDIASTFPDGTSRFLSDYGISGNTVGSAITSLGGTYAAFSHGSTKEYLVAFVGENVSSTAITLTKAFRGWFFDTNGNPIVAQTINNADTFTICNLVWLYLVNNGTILASYTHPRYSYNQPSSSLAGDMWYDMKTSMWMQSNGSVFNVANCIPIGVCVMSSTACVAARTFDVYNPYGTSSNVIPEFLTTSEFRCKYDNNQINVYGSFLNFARDTVRWTTSSLASDTASLSASTSYYLYISELGVPWISKYAPQRRYDLGGWFHPYQSWRCVGIFEYNGSSNFDPSLLALLPGSNGEFLDDRSISVGKLKASPPLIYDANATAPIVAGQDQISVSTILDIPGAAATSPTQAVDANNKAITCSRYCSGRPILIGLTNDYLTPGTPSNFGSLTPGSGTSCVAEFWYYMDGSPIAGGYMTITANTYTGMSTYIPDGSTWKLLFDVNPGLHTFTFYYQTGAATELVATSMRMFTKEI